MLRLRRNDLTSSDLGGELVLLDLDRSVYLSAKGSGALLLNLLIDGATEDELVEALLRRYEIDELVAQQDVEEFLADLGRRELLDIVDE